jgi:hypothetical protein
VYEIPVAKTGYYRVNLLFAETFHGVENGNGVGARVFDVKVEGNTRLTNYDIIQKAGGSAIAIIESLDQRRHRADALPQWLLGRMTGITDRPQAS